MNKFDKDGYPTDKILTLISNYDITNWNKLNNFLSLINSLWSYPDRFVLTEKNILKLYLSTGGWSGNESVIRAMQKNKIFWIVCWEKSQQGGHYWFKMEKCRFKTKEKINENN